MNTLTKIAGPVEYSVEEGVALITLNRPKEYNAINAEMALKLVESITRADTDDSVKAIVLTGRGNAFCAGVDLKEASSNGGILSGSGDKSTPILTAFESCKKPIIGAINGFAVTGGLELAINCDFLYAAETARFADTHAIVGLVPGWGLSQKLPRIIGINRAREMSFTCIYIDAKKAQEWGMVNQVCQQNDLLDEALAAAKLICDAVPIALHKAKQMINTGWSGTLEEGMKMELETASSFNLKADMSHMAERLELLRKRAKNTV